MRSIQGAHAPIPPLVREKLAAFDRIARDFQASFAYVEQMHGERRFPRVPLSASVRYLHALWLCECKDALLSVPLTVSRYDHSRALDLLLAWQAGATSEVVAFLEDKLKPLPFAQLMRDEQTAEHEAPAAVDVAILDRLRHGRAILLNRGLNLHRALDAMFALPTGQLLVEVRLACARLGHTPEQIHEQRTWPETALYRFLPHPALARRNMLLMNSVGVHATSNAMDRPGVRTARVSAAAQPLAAYADTPLVGYTAFTPLPYSKLPFYSNGIPPPALTGEEVSAPSLPT